MAGSALMTVGVRAMAASYAALQTTSHNIANASVEGYSRQRAVLATAQGQYTGAGFFGRGVDVKTVERTHNAFLTREAATAKSISSLDAARLDQLRQLETIFKTGEQGLGNATSEFLNAMSDLASRPADGATRSVVLARADDLARRFAQAGSQLDTIQQSVNSELKSSVDTVNQLAQQIAQANGAIASARGLGQPPNDLLDERDRLISQLSEHVQVSTIAADDGTVGVFIGGGQRLVLGDTAEKLEVMRDPFDGSRSSVGISEGNAATRRMADSALGSGRIAGLLRFQNDDLVDAQNMIGQMSAAIAQAVNDQQKLGLNLHQPVGSVASSDLFKTGEARAYAADGNARDVNGEFIATAKATLVDGTQAQASEYLLERDPAGSGAYQLTRLSDGKVSLIASGDVVDGMQVDVGPPDLEPGDQFLLQPVTRSPNTMQVLLKDPLDLAAASPLTGATPATNTGTTQISALTMSGTPLDTGATSTITFVASQPGDPPGSRRYEWTVVDASSATLAADDGLWLPGQPIPQPPDPDINGFQLTITGVPDVGDVLLAEPTQYPVSNNGNALALASLRDLKFVGRAQQADGSWIGGLTANESYVASLADIGVRVQGGDSAAAISGALAQQAESARADQTGVNLDEEAARLMQFQQSYQAAAKVLQIAQSVFDTLLQTATG